ncbi:unnamed protein product [Darwinula stevensoni]|uniref:Tastin n=1 Tax=Darwinula stevensoni TaxID=69355 RepID=A0A7R8XCY1_9CRUS|nr:unnamed protein product [Darwinula stevensoni]CAG0894143.1 unnamed protein product [Darwinula stevensoni]
MHGPRKIRIRPNTPEEAPLQQYCQPGPSKAWSKDPVILSLKVRKVVRKTEPRPSVLGMAAQVLPKSSALAFPVTGTRPPPDHGSQPATRGLMERSGRESLYPVMRAKENLPPAGIMESELLPATSQKPLKQSRDTALKNPQNCMPMHVASVKNRSRGVPLARSLFKGPLGETPVPLSANKKKGVCQEKSPLKKSTNLESRIPVVCSKAPVHHEEKNGKPFHSIPLHGEDTKEFLQNEAFTKNRMDNDLSMLRKSISRRMSLAQNKVSKSPTSISMHLRHQSMCSGEDEVVIKAHEADDVSSEKNWNSSNVAGELKCQSSPIEKPNPAAPLDMKKGHSKCPSSDVRRGVNLSPLDAILARLTGSVEKAVIIDTINQDDLGNGKIIICFAQKNENSSSLLRDAATQTEVSQGVKGSPWISANQVNGQFMLHPISFLFQMTGGMKSSRKSLQNFKALKESFPILQTPRRGCSDPDILNPLGLREAILQSLDDLYDEDSGSPGHPLSVSLPSLQSSSSPITYT